MRWVLGVVGDVADQAWLCANIAKCLRHLDTALTVYKPLNARASSATMPPLSNWVCAIWGSCCPLTQKGTLYARIHTMHSSTWSVRVLSPMPEVARRRPGCQPC